MIHWFLQLECQPWLSLENPNEHWWAYGYLRGAVHFSHFSSYQVTSFTSAVIWLGESDSRVPELVKWDWNTPCCIVQMTKNINCIWPLPVDNFLKKVEAYAECCSLRTWFISHIRLPYRSFINELNRSKPWFLNNIPRLRRNSRVHVAQPYASLLLICISWHFLLFYYIWILSFKKN